MYATLDPFSSLTVRGNLHSSRAFTWLSGQKLAEKHQSQKKVAVVYFQHMFWLNCHGFSISRRWCTVKKCVRTNTVVLNGIRKVPHRDLKLNIQKVLMGNVGKYMLGSPNRILSCTFHLGCEATVAPAAIEKSNFYQLFQPGKELCHQGVIGKAFSRLVFKKPFQYCTYTLYIPFFSQNATCQKWIMMAMPNGSNTRYGRAHKSVTTAKMHRAKRWFA